MFRCELLQFLEPAEMVKVSMLSAEIHKIVDENWYKYRIINQQQVRNRWEHGTELADGQTAPKNSMRMTGHLIEILQAQNKINPDITSSEVYRFDPGLIKKCFLMSDMYQLVKK